MVNIVEGTHKKSLSGPVQIYGGIKRRKEREQGRKFIQIMAENFTNLGKK